MNRKRRGYYSSTCQYCWQAPAECLNALQKRGSACLLSSAKPIGFCGTGKVSPSSCPLPSRAKLSHSMVSTAHSSNGKKCVGFLPTKASGEFTTRNKTSWKFWAHKILVCTRWPTYFTYNTGTTSSMKKKTLNLKDLFVEPNFDESKTIALNSKGRLKRLSKEQLDSIRKTGEFEVSG